MVLAVSVVRVQILARAVVLAERASEGRVLAGAGAVKRVVLVGMVMGCVCVCGERGGGEMVRGVMRGAEG